MAYNPSRDIVAGRTAYQIETAKRKAVTTGKKKKCKKGKSCGATCINSGRVCMVDLPWVVSAGLKKVSLSIQRKVKAESSKSLGLTLLKTPKDFEDKMKATEGFYNKDIKEMHLEMQRVLGKSNAIYTPIYKDPTEETKYGKVKRIVQTQLGDLTIATAYDSLGQFTGGWHKQIRDMQRGNLPDKFSYMKDKILKWGQDIERLLSVSILPRPEVEKFRGIRTTVDHLNNLIEAYKDGKELPASATTSWSTSLRIGKRFANLQHKPEQTERVIFRTINKTGVPVESVSSVDGEYEMLTTKNSKYKYVGYSPVTYMGNTYHIFDVMESKIR